MVKSENIRDGDVVEIKDYREVSRITEHGEQHAVFQWAGVRLASYPELEFMYAIPNVRAEKGMRMYLAQEGMKAGVSDICLPVARGQYHGLYIEMKRDKKSKVQKTQRKFIAFILSQGYYGKICYGADEAIQAIEAYMNSGEYDERHKFERIK
jgi:hypothetical protein